MKTTLSILLIALSFCTNEVKAAEKDTLYLQSIFQNSSTNLVSERILKFDSIKLVDLMTKFENWGGQNFVNYNEVKTGKTNEQITLTYITSTVVIVKFHVNLVIEFKDNKVRVRAYDYGNAFKPAEYIGVTLIPSVPSKSIYLKNYFEDSMIIYNPKPSNFNYKQKWATGIIQYKLDIEDTINSIETYIKSNLNIETKSDW